MFRMIRLNANFEKTTYVLAFDNNVVAETLSEEQPNYGREYLGKIVQLPINVPDIDSMALKDILGSELDRFLNSQDNLDFDQRRWNELAATGRFFELFRNIRDVARYLNGLKILYSNVHKEVNVIDFMALESIRLLHPDYYDFIRCNKSLFTHLQTSSALYREDVEGARQVLKSKFGLGQLQQGESIEEKRRGSLVWDICKCLFPQLERVERDFSFGPCFSETWRKEKRICSDEVFDKYFIVGIPKGDISTQEMASVMSKSGEDLVLALRGLFDRGLLRRFFELAEEHVVQVEPTNVKAVITALFNIEDVVITERSVALRPPVYFYTASLIIELLLRIDSVEERKRLVLEIMNETDKFFSPIYLIHHITPIKERQSDIAEKDLQRLGFSSDDLKSFQAECVEKMKKKADTVEILKAPHLDLLLHKWRDWGVEEDVNKFVQQLMETEDGLLALLNGFAGERIGTEGRRVLVNKENLGEFTDIESFETKLKELDKNRLDAQQKELLDSFLRGEDLLS